MLTTGIHSCHDCKLAGTVLFLSKYNMKGSLKERSIIDNSRIASSWAAIDKLGYLIHTNMFYSIKLEQERCHLIALNDNNVFIFSIITFSGREAQNGMDFEHFLGLCWQKTAIENASEHHLNLSFVLKRLSLGMPWWMHVMLKPIDWRVTLQALWSRGIRKS